MATASYTPQAAPLAYQAVPVNVYRVGSSGLMGLPNVRFLGCKFEENSTVPQATFRYVFDKGGAVDQRGRWPNGPEDVLGADATGPYVVQPDDHLAVYYVDYSGDRQIVWDGYAMIPAGTIAGGENGRMGVSFVGLGTPIRCYDTPMIQRIQRDGDTPRKTDANQFVDLPIVFNPGGKGNCTPDGTDRVVGNLSFPVFLDDLLVEDTKAGRSWGLVGAVRYILAVGNDQKYVSNPVFSTLSTLLDARDPGASPTPATPADGDGDGGDPGGTEDGGSGPGNDEQGTDDPGADDDDDPDYADQDTGQGDDVFTGGAGEFDNQDGSTYLSSPIQIKEVDVTGLSWPDALQRVIEPYGFRFRFDLSQGDDGMPSWRVAIFREADDDPLLYKSLYLQAGGQLDPARTNVHEMHLARDPVDTANAYSVETALVAYEVAAVLAPGFEIDPSDAADISSFFKAKDTPAALDTYRLYVFDECAEGHWDFDQGEGGEWVVGKPPSFKNIMGGPDADETLYARRRRPGRGTLFSKANDARRKATLLISSDYDGPSPGLWDGSGTWYVVEQGWRQCTDRLGIRITASNPESWGIGNAEVSFGKTVHSSGGKVMGVSAQCLPGETRFYLMLVTVIEGDRVVRCEAPKRDASPSRFTIKRYVDKKKDYKYDVVTRNSWYNQTDDPIVDRDDGRAATDDALARRSANEMPRVAGPVVIRRITRAYSLGDRITDVVGRGISLQTNVGDGGGEGASFPRVVAIEWSFDPEQTTTLHLEDDRGSVRASREAWRRG